MSDDIVWQPLADAVGTRMPVYIADLTTQSSITEMARSVLSATSGSLIGVGHSMGGRVAMEMAHIAPDRVTGLVLANTGHHPRREAELPKRHAMIALGHDSMEKLIAQWLPPMVHPDRTNDAALMTSLRDMVLRADADIHERHIRALIDRPNATQYLPDITCPTLLVAATDDAWSPIQQHEEIAHAMPNAELTIIENAGHFAPLEQPQAVTKAIMAWLEKQAGALK